MTAPVSMTQMRTAIGKEGYSRIIVPYLNAPGKGMLAERLPAYLCVAAPPFLGFQAICGCLRRAGLLDSPMRAGVAHPRPGKKGEFFSVDGDHDLC